MHEEPNAENFEAALREWEQSGQVAGVEVLFKDGTRKTYGSLAELLQEKPEPPEQVN